MKSTGVLPALCGCFWRKTFDTLQFVQCRDCRAKAHAVYLEGRAKEHTEHVTRAECSRLWRPTDPSEGPG